MLNQLVIGTGIIFFSIMLQAFTIGAIETLFVRFKSKLVNPPRIFNMIKSLIVAVLIIMLGVSATVWIWAGLFLVLDISPDLEEALYFATVNVTTLGYGDIIPPKDWRILISLSAANGLIVFGMSTAFLMEMIYELRQAQKAIFSQKTTKKADKNTNKKANGP